MTDAFQTSEENFESFEFPDDELSADDSFETDDAFGEFHMDESFETEAVFDEFLMDEASARRGAAASHAAIELHRSRAQGFERAVRGLAPYVRRQGNTVRLAIPPATVPRMARQLGIPPRGVSILVQSAARARPTPVAREIDYETGAGCQGETRFSAHWWGARLALNSCHTNDLINAALAGAGAAKLCSKIPTLKSKVACGIVAMALALGAALIKGIHERGGKRGIVIRKPWPPIAPPVIWHQ